MFTGASSIKQDIPEKFYDIVNKYSWSRGQAKRDIERAFKSINSANICAHKGVVEKIFGSKKFTWEKYKESDDLNNDLKKALKILDKDIWKSLIEECREDLMLNRGDEYLVMEGIKNSDIEFHFRNALYVLRPLYRHRENYYLKSMVELFKILTNNKSNNEPFKIGNRLIIKNDSRVDSSPLNNTEQKNMLLNVRDFLFRLHCVDLPSQEDDSALIKKLRCGIVHFGFPHFGVRIYEKGNVHLFLNHKKDVIAFINDMIHQYYHDIDFSSCNYQFETKDDL